MMLLAALSVVSFCLLFFNMGQDPVRPVCWSDCVGKNSLLNVKQILTMPPYRGVFGKENDLMEVTGRSASSLLLLFCGCIEDTTGLLGIAWPDP